MNTPSPKRDFSDNRVELPNLEKLRQYSITKLNTDTALEHIGVLVDASQEAGFTQGANRALYLLEKLEKHALNNKQRVISEYFRANAWTLKEETSSTRSHWDWEHPEREQQILALSRAAIHPGFVELDQTRRSQILTNRANKLNAVGRLTDAIEGWDAALQTTPNFAIA